MTTDLVSALCEFPTKEHVKKICKHGQGSDTCRYLSVGGGRWNCEKFSGMQRGLEQRAKDGTINARSDNCGGLLDIIVENRAGLIGKKIRYKETSPTLELEGTLKELSVKDGALCIIGDWENPKVSGDLGIATKALKISIAGRSITFELAGLGAFGGVSTIFL